MSTSSGSTGSSGSGGNGGNGGNGRGLIIGGGHGDGSDSPMLMAARAYTRRGWRVVPARPREKGVTIRDWQNMRLDEGDLPRWFQGAAAHNIGLLTGEPSGGLIDVDCDSPEAVMAAEEILPQTAMRTGHFSNQASHYWYQVARGGGALPQTARFTDITPERTDSAREGAEPADPQAAAQTDTRRLMLVELRSTGCQTIVPPSMHPCGEEVHFYPLMYDDGVPMPIEPAVFPGPYLLANVQEVAATALLARHWPARGERDEAAKDLAGLLLRAGWDVNAVDRFSRRVAKIAGDEEWWKRGKAYGTKRKMDAGEPVTGGRSLAPRLAGNGVKVVSRLVVFLGLSNAGAMGDVPEAPRGLGNAYAIQFGRLGQLAQPDPELAQLAQYPVMSKLSKLEDDGRIWTGWTDRASALEPTQVRWLWDGRIPLGAITLLDGDPGLGKSLLTLDLAARVTTGRAMPDGAPGVADGAGVALLSAEDDVTATILPRLVAAGADMNRVEIVRGVTAQNQETGQEQRRPFLLPTDIPILEEIVQRVGARLVVIDPLMAYLDGRVNSWRDQDVRATLAPLADLAERTGVAILILRHLNKATGMSALYRGGGSIGIIGAARSGLLVAKHPDDPDHERALASTKSNLGPPMPSLRYRLATRPEHPLVPYVVWQGECDLSAEELLAVSQAGKDGRDTVTPSKLAEAAAWLSVALADGPRPATELARESRAEGISDASLRRARKVLGLVNDRIGSGGGAHSVWRLPDAKVSTVTPAPDAPQSVQLAQLAQLAQYPALSKLDTDEQVGTDGAATTPQEPPSAPANATSAVSDVCPRTGGSHRYDGRFRDHEGRMRCAACWRGAPDGEGAAGWPEDTGAESVENNAENIAGNEARDE